MNDIKRRRILQLLEDKRVNLWWVWSYIREGLSSSQIVERYNKIVPFESGKLNIEDAELLIEWNNEKYKR